MPGTTPGLKRTCNLISVRAASDVVPDAGPQTEFKLNTQFFEKEYKLEEVVGNAWLFFEAQRSGKLPSDNRINWRGDSSLFDGQQHAPALNLTGGWHDAGGSIKASFPFCASVRLPPPAAAAHLCGLLSPPSPWS